MRSRQSLIELRGAIISAQEGEVGLLTDYFFDEKRWIIRYLAVGIDIPPDTRETLVSTEAVVHVTDERILLNISRQQFLSGPSINLSEPISRQHEMALHDHYSWPYYWQLQTFEYTAPITVTESVLNAQTPLAEKAAKPQTELDTQEPVRSINEMQGMFVYALDGEAGHVDDVFISAHKWNIQYLAIDTHSLTHGRKILVPVECVDLVAWSDAKIVLSVTRGWIKNNLTV